MLGVLLTELANAAAAVLLTVCAVSVVNTTVSHVRCPYYVYVWLFIFSVISGFINRLTSLDTRKWVRHAINTGLLLVFVLGVFIANWQAAEHIKDGFLYVKGRYLEIINVYYGTSFVCPKGDKAFAGAFVGFVSFIVMLLLVTLAVQIKRRRMLTLFPTLMLAVQLCIGKSPSVSEVVMLTLCTLWCLIADGNARTVAGYDANGSAQGNEVLRIAAAFLYMAAVSVVLFICVFSFKPLADTLADKKPQMLAFQKDLEGSVKSFFSVGIDLQDGTVSNHYPSYSEKTVMTVEAKAGVPSNIYMRSFYGDTYENGRWIKKSDFSGMEKEYHDASRMTAWQTTIGLATLLDGYYDDETNPATEKYTITMEKLSTKYTYLPYCIDPYSIDAKGDIDFDEDFFITKDKGTKTIEVSACPGFFDGSLETSSLEPEQPLEVNNDFYAAYNNYVMENYTAKQGGDGIVAEDAKWLLRTGQLTSNMMYTGYIRENDANRIAAAQLVQQFLTSKAFKYSKNPPSTGGKDVVENFLSNSRQGFCAHHVRMLYAEKNRLGLALMLKTHTDKTIRDLKALSTGKPVVSGGLFKKQASSSVSDYIKRLEDSCFICNRMKETSMRYIDTIFHLWKKEPEFRKKFANCKGFCTYHYGILYDEGSVKLPKDAYAEFQEILNKTYFAGMERVSLITGLRTSRGRMRRIRCHGASSRRTIRS